MMETDMVEMAIRAAIIISDPVRLSFLALGVVLGLILGVIPGLGGLVGLSLLLPFTFNMDPFAALALMMGLASVTVTSDTIPAVLLVSLVRSDRRRRSLTGTPWRRRDKPAGLSALRSRLRFVVD